MLVCGRRALVLRLRMSYRLVRVSLRLPFDRVMEPIILGITAVLAGLAGAGTT